MPLSRRMFGSLALLAPLAMAPKVRAEEILGRDDQFRRILGREPRTANAVGVYAPLRRVGNLLYLSTTVARESGQPVFSGLVGADLSLEQGQAAARAAALALLETVHQYLDGSLARVRQVVSIVGYVASADDFFQQAEVMNGASALLVDVLGDEAGLPARSAIGVKALSRNAAVAVSGLVEISE